MKIRILGFLALGAIVLFGFFKFGQPTITNWPSLNSGVVAFGDSLVEGVGATEAGGFVSMLERDLEITIGNLGKRGDTTGSALRRVENVVAKKPAVTIVLLGGNDFLNGVPEAETFENLGRTIEKLHEAGSAVIIVGIEADVPGNRHGEFFERLHRDYQTAYVPHILEGIYGNQPLMSDGLHPNDAGYRLMAERIKLVLSKLIEK